MTKEKQSNKVKMNICSLNKSTTVEIDSSDTGTIKLVEIARKQVEELVR